jgi:hypothetical protein
MLTAIRQTRVFSADLPRKEPMRQCKGDRTSWECIVASFRITNAATDTVYRTLARLKRFPVRIFPFHRQFSFVKILDVGRAQGFYFPAGEVFEIPGSGRSFGRTILVAIVPGFLARFSHQVP